MSSGYRYFTGDYLKYYNELGSNAGLSSKANSFRSSVEIISRDFEMIKSVMNTWSGEGASAMSIEAISSIMNKFNMTKENINSSLIPATEAMEKLVENLKLMKEKEETLIKTEELLSIERAKDIPSTIYDGKDKKGNDIYKHNPAYDSWIDNIKRLEEEVNLLIKELEQLKQLCDESIELVKMFESQIREFSDFIGIANSVIGINGESGDFASMSFEERIAFLNNILVEYGKVKEKLDAFYMEKYGRGFSLSNEDFENIFMLFDAFDLFYKSGTSVSEFKNLPTEGGNVLLKIDALIKVMSYCEYTGAIDKITNYLNGESWEESGLAELYEQDGIFGYNEKRFNQRMRTFYGINNPKEYLKNKLDNILGSWNNLEKAYGEFQVTRQAIGIMNQKIDNLETAMKLLPYEIHIEDELFIEKYKGVKFGDIPGLDELFNKHMTDDEKALYKYLCDTKGVDYANEYLGLMEDPMNMREGMARAKEYVEWIGRDGFQVVDIANGGFEGFKDGVRNFFDGVGDLFRVADTQAGTKSALDYEMMFKAQYMLDAADSLGIDIDPNIRNMLNQAYQTGNTVGTMAVPMIAGAIPGVGQTLSTVLMTASFTGNAAVEGRQNGLDVGAAYLYGAISGGSEVVLERALGAVPFVGDLSGSLLKDTCSEMLEESIQTVFDAGLNYVFYGEETTGAELLGNVLESAKQAAISTPFMQGFGKAVGPTVGGASTIATNLITGNSYTIGEVYQLADNKVSSFFMNKADVAIHGGIDAVQSNGQVSFLDKVLLDKSINSVSAEELATITSNIPKSDVAQLVDSGLLSNKSVEKLRLADTVASISSQDAGSLDVSSLTKSDLSSEVTRNGKTLSEYIANTKADSITESTMNDLRQISAKEARVVETTMNDNAKAFARQERSTNIRSGIESSISTPTVESPTAFTAQESGVQVTENLPSTYAATSSTDNLQSSQRALETFTPSSEYSASYSETSDSMIADSLTPIINDGAISLSQYDTMEQTTTTEGSIPTVAKASSIGLAGGVAAMTMMNVIGTTNATVNTENSTVVNGQTRKIGNAESLFANSSESSLSKDTTISTQTTESSYNEETISSETTTTSMYGGLSSITPNYSATDNVVLDFQSSQVESISDTVDSYFSTIKDMEYAINKMVEKYKCSREECYAQIRTLIKTGNFNYMTSNGNARTILQQYSLNQIQNALDSIIEMDSVTSKMESDVEYSIEKYIERFKVDRKEALEALHRLVNEKAYNYMTSYGNARSILQQYSFKQIQTILNKIELSEGINQKIEPIILNNLDPSFSTSKFFEAHGNPENETYGVDQGTIYKMFEFQSRDGTAYSYREAMQIVENAKQERKPLPKFTKIGTLEYFELKKNVIQKYGLTDKEASILLTCIDNTGACSYASVCNEIFDYFKEKETSFEKTFGYPMYKTVDGNQVLNSEYLLLDLYMFANNIDNGGKFVYKDNNGRHHLNTSLLSEQVDPLGRRLLKTNMQMYMSSSSGKNKEIINKFLNSKGLRYETNILVDYGSKINSKKMDETIEHVIEGIKKGYNYSLGIYSRGQPINMRAPRGVSYGSVSTTNWSEGGGHSVFVTSIDSSGFIVSSWGRKYIIPFSDLRNGGLWVLNEGKILEKGAYSDKLFNVSNWRNLGGIKAKETVGLTENAISTTMTNATSTVNDQSSLNVEGQSRETANDQSLFSTVNVNNSESDVMHQVDINFQEAIQKDTDVNRTELEIDSNEISINELLTEMYSKLEDILKELSIPMDEKGEIFQAFDVLKSKIINFGSLENILNNFNAFTKWEIYRFLSIDNQYILEKMFDNPGFRNFIVQNMSKKEILNYAELIPANSLITSTFLSLTTEELNEMGTWSLFNYLENFSSDIKKQFIDLHIEFFEKALDSVFYVPLSDEILLLIWDRLGSYDLLCKKSSLLSPEVQIELYNKYKNEIYNGTQKTFIALVGKLKDGIFQTNFIKNSPFFAEIINSTMFTTLLSNIKSREFALELISNPDARIKMVESTYAFENVVRLLTPEEQKMFIETAKKQILRISNTNYYFGIELYIKGFDKELQLELLNDEDIINSLPIDIMLKFNREFNNIYLERIKNNFNGKFDKSNAELLFDPSIYPLMTQDSINRAAFALSFEKYDKLVELGNQEAIDVVIDKMISNNFSEVQWWPQKLGILYDATNDIGKKKIADNISIDTLISIIQVLQNEQFADILVNKLKLLSDLSYIKGPTLKNISEFKPEIYKKILPYLSNEQKITTFSYENATKLGIEEEFVGIFRENPNLINFMRPKESFNFLKLLSTKEDIETYYSNLEVKTLFTGLNPDYSVLDLTRIKAFLEKNIYSYNFEYINEYENFAKLLAGYNLQEQLEILDFMKVSDKYFLLLDGRIKAKEIKFEVLKTIMHDSNFRSFIDFDIKMIEDFFDNLELETIDYILKNADENFLGFMLATVKRNDLNLKFREMINENALILNKFEYSDAELIYGNLSSENKILIDNVINSLIASIGSEKVHSLLQDATTAQKSSFIDEYNKGLITNEKLDLLARLKSKNKFVLSTFNYSLFDDIIYQFGENLLSKLSKYYDVVEEIVKLKNNPLKFNLFANFIINDSKSSSPIVSDQKMAMLLNHLLETDIEQVLLEPHNLAELETSKNIILKQIDQFSILDSNEKEIIRKRSIIVPDHYTLADYDVRLAEKCDLLLQEATTVDEVQNLIFNRYFSISIEDAKELFRMYGSRFNEIKNLDSNGIATLYLENMKNILNMTSMEEAIDFYNSFNTVTRYNMEDVLNIINNIKKAYTKSLKNTLFNPTEITGYVEYEGKSISIYEPKENFQMLIQSTYTNYGGGMPIINDNYFDSWNLSSRTANHGICCSLISNNNMGMAVVRGPGVVIGFNSFSDEQINMMAPYDIYTRNDGYVIKCKRPLLYLPGEDVMNETRHTHNEFNLERTNLTGEGELANIQPDYVVVFEEMLEEQKRNAYKASIEFGVPLVYINKTSLAAKESAKIDNLILEYQSNGNVELLKEILILHENNRSGYRNPTDSMLLTKYFLPERIDEVLKKGILQSSSIEELTYIKEFLKDELNKFNSTYEATHRVNVIDIDINTLIEQIDMKISELI